MFSVDAPVNVHVISQRCFLTSSVDLDTHTLGEGMMYRLLIQCTSMECIDSACFADCAGGSF